MKLAFAECDEAQLPALRDFFRRAYAPGYRLASDEALLRWQFAAREDAPGRFRIKIAGRGDRIHACLGYLPVEIDGGGRRLRGAWSANWMVEAEYRQSGLGALLIRQLTSEHEVVFVAGLGHEAADFLRRLGWHDFGDLRRHIAVLDAGATRRLLDGGHAPAPVGGLRRPARAAAIDVGEAAQVWEAAVSTGLCGTRRSASFLEWRYRRHPTFHYDLIGVRSASGAVGGFAVYRAEDVRDQPVRVGRLVEFVAAGDAAAELADAVVAHAAASGAALIDFFCASRRFDGALVAAGFAADAGGAAGVPLVFQPIDRTRRGIRLMACLGALGDAAPALDWYVTKGDGDQDRPN